MSAGMSTPWGIACSQEPLDEGAVQVETANHGGILIEQTYAQTLLSPKACTSGVFWDHFLAFEQERAMMVVFYEHPEWYPWVETELTKKLAEDLLRQDYPDYFTDA